MTTIWRDWLTDEVLAELGLNERQLAAVIAVGRVSPMGCNPTVAGMGSGTGSVRCSAECLKAGNHLEQFLVNATLAESLKCPVQVLE